MEKKERVEDDPIKLEAKEMLEKWNAIKSICPLDTETKNVISAISQNLLNSNECETNIDSELDQSENEEIIYSSQLFLQKHESLTESVGNNYIFDDVQLESIATEIFKMKLIWETSWNEFTDLSNKVNNNLQLFTKLHKELESVFEKTDLLDSRSGNLLTEHTELSDKHQQITDQLKYYLSKESIKYKLQNSNYLISNAQSFYEILDKIDSGIIYMKEHLNFKQSQYYLDQYKSFLCLALNLIKYYISNVLNAVDILTISTETDKLKEVRNSNTEQTSVLGGNKQRPQELDPDISFLYGKFQAIAFKIQPLIHQVEQRSANFNEYGILLEQLQQIYVDKRYELMHESIVNSIRAVIHNNKCDRSLLFRTACSLFIFICQDEYQLFYAFFSTKTDKLDNYLSSICSHLYDNLRPIIVQIEHIEILCELCTILKFEILVNCGGDTGGADDNTGLDAFGKVVTELLHDIQERLVFRSHIYFRMDILNYNPSGGDLAYPDKLQMMLDIVTSSSSANLQRTESQQSIVSSSATGDHMHKPIAVSDLQAMWYPTIRRTLQCLSRLYRCVDVQTFQGLSQEAISFCVISIIRAGDAITQRSSALDGYLFEISHLLILREQIAAFQVDFQTRETTLDFSKVKEAATDLINRKNLFTIGTNNAILKLLLDGTPQVKEHVLDSKKDADVQLKYACQNLIAHVTKLFIHDLEQINQAIQLKRKEKDFDLNKFRQLEWTQPEYLAQLINNVIRNIKSQIKPIQYSMTLYINNKETESILFRPIKNNIIGAFVQLEQLLSECYYELDELRLIGCPTADQISLMLSFVTLVNLSNANDNQHVTSTNSDSIT